MKRSVSLLLAFMLVTTLFLMPQANALSDIHSIISSSYTQQLESLRGIDTKDDSEVFSVTSENGAVTFDYYSESGSLSFSGSSNVPLSSRSRSGIQLTEIESGFLVQCSANTTSGISSQQLTVDMPDTWSIDYARTSAGTIANGSLGIYNEFGEPVASTGLVSATDGNGNELEAELIINGNTIQISFDDPENIAAPVSASYGVYATNASKSITDYFSYSGFNIVYDGSLTLGNRYFDEGSTIECTNAWNAAYTLYYPTKPHWTTETQVESMEDQYWCHANFAKNKDNWNLEPWRPVVSWSTMVLNACNPS